MGVFNQTIEVAVTDTGPFLEVSALVDTGAFYSWLLAQSLHRLGIEPHTVQAFQMANGQVIERPVGRAWVKLAGRMEQTLVVFGDDGTQALLGAYTLEGLALAVDPVHRKLVPIATLPMAAFAPEQRC